MYITTYSAVSRDLSLQNTQALQYRAYMTATPSYSIIIVVVVVVVIIITIIIVTV